MTEPPTVPTTSPAATAVGSPVEGGTDGRLSRNVAALSLSQLATWSMSLVWTVVVPRVLGPSGMGVVVTALSVTAVLGVLLGVGTSTFLTRQLVADRAVGEPLMGSSVLLHLLLAPVFLAAIQTYGTVAGFGAVQMAVLYLVGVATLLGMLAAPLQAAFQATERMHFLAYTDLINKSAQGLLGVAVVLAGAGVLGVGAATLTAAVAVMVLDWRWVRRRLGFQVRLNPGRLGAVVRGSTPYWAMGLFFTVYLWVDSMILSMMAPARVVGWYGVPTRLFTTLMFVPTIVSTAWLPRLVSAFTSGADRLRQVARVPTELIVVVSLPACMGTVIAADPLIRHLYGAPFEPSIPVLEILALCVPPMYTNVMLNQVVVAANRQVVWTWMMAGATVVNPILNVVLIGVWQSHFHNGAEGAAVALLLTELLIVVAGMAVVGGKILNRASWWRFCRSLMATAAMGAAGWEGRRVSAVFGVAVALMVFAALAVPLRLLNRQDVEMLVPGSLRRLLSRGPRPPASTALAAVGGDPAAGGSQ